MTLGEASKPLELRTYMPMRYRSTLAVICIAAVSILLATGPWLLLAGLVAAAFAAALTMNVRIRLDEVGLSIRVASFFSTTIPYHEISAVSAGPVTGFRQGMGLRILPGGGTGYLVGGPSVRIQCGDNAILVSCASAQKLVARVDARIFGKPLM
jgi:uncharacterized membrane protein YhhN